MIAPLPAWIPVAPGPAAGEALHLRFAIVPVGPALPQLAGGAETLMGSAQASAWHELTLAALLVCLAVDEAELAADPDGSVMAEAEAIACPLPDAPRSREGLDDGVLAGPTPSSLPGLDEEWMKLLLGRSGLDGAWMLA